jgi:hypothetical protein
MSNETALLSILAITIVVFYNSMWVNKVINDRGDEIRCGVVKGVAVPTKYRRLLLFTNWLPYAAFLISVLVVTALGILEIAKAAQEPRITLLGYACATLCATGALFWSVLGSFLFADMVSAIRSGTP